MYLHILFFILSFFSFLEIFTSFGRDKSKIKLLFILIMCILFLFAAIRWERGTDWQTYYLFFVEPERFGHNSFEYGFTLLNKLVRTINGNFTLLLLIQSYLYYTLMTKVILKVSIFPLFSLLVLFIVGSYAGFFFVRQTVAIAITTYSFLYIKERKLLKFILCVLGATMLHVSSILFILSYYIYKLEISTRKLLICLFIAFMLGYFLSIFMERYTLLGGVLMAKFNGYIEEGTNIDIVGMSASSLYLRGVLSRFFSFLLIFSFIFSYRKQDAVCRGLFNIYLLGIVVYILAGAFNITLSRLANCFDVFQIFLFCYAFRLSQNLKTRLIFFVLLVSFLCVRLVSKNPYENLFVPYKSIFNKELPVEVG